MTTRIKQNETDISYFTTFTCHKWMPLFELTNLYDNIYKWFDIIVESGNSLLGYVIMPNHLHAIILFRQSDITINDLIAEGKKFRAWEIVNRLKKKNCASELDILANAVSPSEKKKGSIHKVFEDSFDCKQCFTLPFIQQKLTYIHNNPVKAGLVINPEDYVHSSAKFYMTGEKGIYPVSHYLNFYDVLPA